MRKKVLACLVILVAAVALWYLTRSTPPKLSERTGDVSQVAPSPSTTLNSPHAEPTKVAPLSADPAEELRTPDETEGASISGRVYDVESGRTVLGATVFAQKRGRDQHKVSTDENGAFILESLEPGNWRIYLFRGSGYPSVAGEDGLEKFVSLAESQILEGFDFPLKFGTTLAGTVTDESGRPIPEAKLQTGYPQNHQRAVTDTDGRFMLTGLTSGEKLPLHITAEGYGAVHNEWTNLPATGIAGVVIALAPESIISGIIVDRNGIEVTEAMGWALDEDKNWYRGLWPGRVIRISPPEDPPQGGNFEIRGLASGRYTLHARKMPDLTVITGAGTFFSPTDYPSLTEVSIGKAQHLRNVRLQLDIDEIALTALNAPKGPEVRGYVRDDMGAGIVGAVVRGGGVGTSDQDGFYQFRLRKNGSFYLSVTAEGFSNEDKGEFPEGTTDIDFVMERKGSILGHVLDDATGLPVTPFEVARGKVRRRGGGTSSKSSYEYKRETDIEGIFTIEDQDASDIEIMVRAPGFATSSQFVTVAPGEQTEIEVRLQASAIVRGRVLDPQGNSVAEAQIFIGDPPDHMDWQKGNSHDATAFSSFDGTFSLESLPLTATRISAFSPGFLETSVDFVLRSGTETVVDIVLTMGGIVEGVVSYAGNGIEGQKVTLKNGRLHNGEMGTQSDSRGHYRFTGIPAGTWDMSAVINPPGERVSAYRDRRTVSIDGETTVVVNFAVANSNASVEGYILGLPEDTNPIRVRVEWKDTDGRRMTASDYSNSEQYYRIDYVSPGPARLYAHGYRKGGSTRTLNENIDLVEGSVVRHDFDFSTQASIEGELTSHWPQVRLAVYAIPGRRTIDVTSRELAELISTARKLGLNYKLQRSGAYKIHIVDPGVYTILALSYNVGDESPIFASSVVTIKTGDELKLDFNLD